jgi:hypothetical protein
MQAKEQQNYELWRQRNKYYYDEICNFHHFLIGENKKVVELAYNKGNYGSVVKGTSDIITEDQIQQIISKPEVDYDYVVAHGFFSMVPDIQASLRGLNGLCKPDTRIIVSTYNAFWEPVLKLGSKLKLRSSSHIKNYLSETDLENLFYLEDFEIICKYDRVLLPKLIPVISWLANKILIHAPILRSMALMKFYVLRKHVTVKNELSVAIVIPARNEAGNIENAIKRLPAFGTRQEIIFVEGNSTDNTWAEIERVRLKYPNKNIITLKQGGKGKGDAVRKGYDHATADILFILDADLTVPPEDLPKFYDSIASGKAEFVNGTRLVYPMEKQAMRFLNLLGNKFFAWAFSWLLGQKFRDTLCGTKVLKRSHYLRLAANRSYFGDFDPFGDFDLIFGAAKQNLKIVEIPVRYRERTYGETNISRFTHGWLLLKMCFYAAKKIKFC